eukprot:3469154-Pyramimonas_sp.AAC.1
MLGPGGGGGPVCDMFEHVVGLLASVHAVHGVANKHGARLAGLRVRAGELQFVFRYAGSWHRAANSRLHVLH